VILAPGRKGSICELFEKKAAIYIDGASCVIDEPHAYRRGIDHLMSMEEQDGAYAIRDLGRREIMMNVRLVGGSDDGLLG